MLFSGTFADGRTRTKTRSNTTVGYGDSTPETHFGRLILCFVMIFGTILMSMMTAVATGFIELNGSQALIQKHSDQSRRRMRVTRAVCRCYFVKPYS